VIVLLLLGIVFPAVLLVACVRRWIAPVPWTIALLLMTLTLVFLHGAVFSSRLPVPVDEVARGYPWRGLFGDVVAANPLTNDTVKQFFPWMQVAREELAHGRAPLWNRYFHEKAIICQADIVRAPWRSSDVALLQFAFAVRFCSSPLSLWLLLVSLPVR
jgi:hypothetical protein